MLPARRLAGAGQRLRPPLRTASHPRSHTHSHSLARSHTRTPLPPPALFISSSCLGTQEKPSTAPAPRSLRPRPAPHSQRLRYGDSARQFPEWRSGAPPTHPPLPAPGQRLLPAAPTNLLVGEPRTAAANPRRRSPDRQPVGGRKSWARPWGILGVVVFLHRRTPAARAHPAQLPLVTRTRLLSYIHVKCSLLSLLGHSPHPLPPEADTVSQQPSQDFLRAP